MYGLKYVAILSERPPLTLSTYSVGYGFKKLGDRLKLKLSLMPGALGDGAPIEGVSPRLKDVRSTMASASYFILFLFFSHIGDNLPVPS